MAFYDDMQEVATNLVTEFGTSVSLRKIVSGAYDPATGAVTQSSTDHAGKGIKVGYRQDMINGETVLQGDQMLFLTATKTDGTAMPAPDTTDRIVIGSSLYQIIADMTVQPAATTVVYKLQIRGL